MTSHTDPTPETEKIRTGEALFSQGKMTEAIQCFENLLTTDPSNVEALNNLGVVAFQLDDISTAENIFTKSLQIHRRHMDSLINLAEICIAKGQTDHAENLLKKATGIKGAPSIALSRLNEIKFSSDTPNDRSKENSRILTPKKILFINNLYPPQELGGYGRVIYDYANLIKKRGHSIHVLTSDTRYLGDPAPHEANVDRSLMLFGDWSEGRMTTYSKERAQHVVDHNRIVINKVLQYFQPDLCLVGNIDLLSALVFSPIFDHGIPVLHRLGNEFVGYNKEETPTKHLFYTATASHWLKWDAISRGYPFHNAFVIHSGASVKEFAMAIPPATDKLRIAFAGIVNAYKGPQVLLDALYILHQRGLNFSCSIAGSTFDEPFVDHLKQGVKYLAMDHKLSFTGWLDREGLKDLYARHNVLVFPSLVNETFGISQVEAMAAGLLAITSASGGAKEVVEDGVSGLFFKQGDPHHLARILTELTKDRERWERIALNGQKRAMEMFDIEKSVDELETAFARMLNDRDDRPKNEFHSASPPLSSAPT